MSLQRVKGRNVITAKKQKTKLVQKKKKLEQSLNNLFRSQSFLGAVFNSHEAIFNLRGDTFNPREE